jgi:hypothetical protein
MFNWLRTAAFSTLLGALALGAGCAQERDPINKVQPNVLNKHFFLGADLSNSADDPQFFWRSYVVDASASNSMIGIGSWQGIDRVVFEVTENMILVRKAYAIVNAQDNKASNADPNVPSGTDAYGRTLVRSEQGTVVAAYSVQSHFDIRRSYNPQTGEELNIVEENSSDRPWYQRDYMRVDWSTNQVENPMWEDMFAGKLFGNVDVTSLAYSVTDPRNEDAPVIDEAAGYMDITNKYYVTPATTASPFSDLTGKVPTCLVVGLFTGTASYECDAQEAVVRHSYWRIDPAQHDVEPLENTEADLDVIGNPGGLGSSFQVGIVTAGRQGFDPQYGYTDALFHRFAHRHNVWQKTHVDTPCNSNVDIDDADGNGRANGTADACEGVSTGHKGSQCDVFVGKCTIPIRDRQIKTIGYWVNKDAPPELQDTLDPQGNVMMMPDGQPGRGTLEDLIDSWNQLMRVGLATSREVECRRTGDGNRDDCHAEYFSTGMTSAGLRDPASMEMVHFGHWLVETPIALKNDPVYPAGYPDAAHLKGLQPLTFCHNPVREYDRHDVCGPTGQKARVGDIRKNFIFYWPYDSRAPWGGIANWEGDPLTGEIIGGAAQVMGRSATYAAAYNRDVLQVAMGDVKIEDLIDGIQAQNYVKELQNGHGPFAEAVPLEEQNKRLNAIDWNNLVGTLNQAPLQGTPQQQQFQTLKHMSASVADPREFSTAQLEFENLVSKVRGTPTEAKLVDSSWLVNALGVSPNTPINESILEQASPLRGMDPGRLYALRDILEARLDARGICFLDHHAPSYGSVAIPSLAKYFKDKYPGDPIDRGKKIYDEIWKETVKGIALHEIGHSLGMLHQFASSWDAQNYNPQYWQLRTNEGASTTKCAAPRDATKPDTCMGPRYNDPETLDEQGLADESRPDVMYFGNTSTMEYQYERFLENVGLGTFDLHTMKALYGGVIESIDSRVTPSIAEQRSLGWRSFTQLIDKDLYNGNFVHYTEEARKLSVFDPQRDCRPATDAEKQSGKWRVVHGKVCAPAPRDNWAWRDFPVSDYVYFNNGACKGSNPQCNDGAGGGLYGPYWHAMNVPGAPGGDQGKEFVRWNYKWGVSHNAYYHTNDSDAGADAYEVTLNTIKRFDATYPWAYFRRQNKEYYYRSIANSTTDRYFQRLHAYNWLVATNLGRATNQTANSDDAYKPDVMAQAEMAKFLTRTMTLPEPGGFNVSNIYSPPDATHQIYDVQTNGSSLFSVGVVTGRYINEQYSNILGGSWDYLNWVDHAGFTTEKQRLIESIVDSRPTLFTISRENALDGRNVYINFRTNLPSYSDRIVGGIMAGDWDSLGQYIPSNDTSKVPTLQTLDLTAGNPSRNDPSAKVIFPNIGYKSQIATALYTTIFAQLGGDQTLVNKMRVWIDGQVGQVVLPDAQKILMTDPISGYTYVARKYGNEDIDGKTVEKGIASRMLQHGNAMIAQTYIVQRDGNNKPILDSFGRPTLVLDGNGQPQESGLMTTSELGRYVAIIDEVKGIEYLLGYSPH